MATKTTNKQRYEKQASLLFWEDIISKKTGEVMTKASYLVDGRVYNAWMFENERVAFVNGEKAKAVATTGDPVRGVLSFSLSFGEKGVYVKDIAFV